MTTTAPSPGLTHEELNRLPIRRYEGPVVLVATPGDLERARREILDEAVVGLDTETRPAFRKGEVHKPSLAQVAASRAVYLFPLRHPDCSAVLAELLGSPAVVKAGVGLRDDFAKLRMRFDFEEESVVDLSSVARGHGMKRTGVRTLAAVFLGLRVPKGLSTSNWGRARLTPKQILYAATDAWVCREIYLCFRERGLLAL